MATTHAFAHPPRLTGTDLCREIRQRHAALARQSHHEVLGVEPGEDLAGVRAAYRRLARCFHPDAQSGASKSLAAETQAIFIRATEAYRELSRSDPAPNRPRPRRPTPSSPVPRSTQPPPRFRPTAHPRGGASRLLDGERRKASAPSVDDVLRAAKETLLKGDAPGAVSLLHGLVARTKDADARRVRRLLARAYTQEPRWRRYAADQLRSLVDECPEDAEALALLGVLYYREGLLSRAESTLKRALEADPRQPDGCAALLQVQKERRKADTSDQPRDPGRPGLLARLLAPRAYGGRHA